jgi:hypothetical protein
LTGSLFQSNVYMSSIGIGSIAPPAANETDRFQWTSAVARYTRIRRGQIGLTINRAAELFGLEQLQWIVLEAGWVPESHYRSTGQTPLPES